MAERDAACGITGIDHTLVGVRDLEATRRQWQRLGFTVTPRGRHIGWGTANYCVMLEPGYVELLGIVDPAQFTNDLDKFLAGREGLLGLAFASADGDETYRRLAAAGLHPDGPKDLKRLLELPQGDVLPAFRLVFLPPDETPALRAFVCHHLTPALIRRPEWLGHANGATALGGVTVVADDPIALAPAYQRLFGAAAVIAGDGALDVDAGQGRLRFVTAAGLAALYPGVDLPRLPPPWTAAMTIAVADLGRTLAYFRARGLAPVVSGDGAVLPPAAANGALLDFRERAL